MGALQKIWKLDKNKEMLSDKTLHFDKDLKDPLARFVFEGTEPTTSEIEYMNQKASEKFFKHPLEDFN